MVQGPIENYVSYLSRPDLSSPDAFLVLYVSSSCMKFQSSHFDLAPPPETIFLRAYTWLCLFVLLESLTGHLLQITGLRGRSYWFIILFCERNITVSLITGAASRPQTQKRET